MSPALRSWLRLLLPVGFSLSVWVHLRSRVTLSTSSQRGRSPVEGGGDLDINIYGFPFGFIHASPVTSGEMMVYWLPVLGNALVYAGVLAVLLWLLHAHLPRPQRWVQSLTWFACVLTLAYIVFESSIGSWRWINPWEVTEVMNRELSVGFPVDRAP